MAKKGKEKTVVTPWRLVPEGGIVILKGRRWSVDRKVVDKKTGAVVITIGSRRFHYSAKETVEFVLSDLYPDVSDDAVKIAKAASKKGKKKSSKPPKKPKIEPGEEWSAPAKDKLGKVVEKKLGGKLVGVKPTKTEDYVVPLLDPSTIAAHLYAFHGLTPESRRYEPMKALHDDEHARFERGELDLALPHWHEERKPR